MISIAMCTYNGEKFIQNQLESIINQTQPPDEIIICDDCSTDNTVDKVKSILKNWKNSWRIVVNDYNLGFKKNFEKAISLCSGDIIFLSDQDDIWLSDKIEKIARVFNENPNCLLVFHDAKVVSLNQDIAPYSLWSRLEFKYENIVKGDYRAFLNHGIVQGCACAFRRNLFKKAYPFPTEAIHDEWLGLIAALIPNSIIPEPHQFIIYQQTGQNVFGSRKEGRSERIKRWILKYKESKLKHYNEICRRADVFQKLTEKSEPKSNISGVLISSINSFYDARRMYMTKRSLFLILYMRKYFLYYPRKELAVKNFIKDMLIIL